MSESKHRLVDGTLKTTGSGIVAQCECGWASTHFSSLAASAAFMEHQENAATKLLDEPPK